MNWNEVEGRWKEIKGLVREKWGKLTDQELEEIGGKKDRLLAKIQSSYGTKKEIAEKDLDDLIKKMKAKH